MHARQAQPAPRFTQTALSAVQPAQLTHLIKLTRLETAQPALHPTHANHQSSSRASEELVGLAQLVQPAHPTHSAEQSAPPTKLARLVQLARRAQPVPYPLTAQQPLTRRAKRGQQTQQRQQRAVAAEAVPAPMADPFAGACAKLGMLDMRLLRRPLRTCPQLEQAACDFFFLRTISSAGEVTETPCVWQPERRGCAASERRLCTQPPHNETLSRSAAAETNHVLVQGARKRRAFRDAHRGRRISLAHIAKPCASKQPDDTGFSDCEGWCSRSSMDHCKFCKCRGCSSCYTLPLPAWATSNPISLLSTCDLFGHGVCNRTGQFSRELSEAWRLWSYNRSSQWIDDVFNQSYARESVGFVAQMVAAEDGLSEEEQQELAQEVLQ